MTNLKTIYLTEDELKKAIINFLSSNGEEKVSQHLANNECSMQWRLENYEDQEFAISIDAELEDLGQGDRAILAGLLKN
tara:strand:+ start:25951 stop:26187 length:237 start_codon:yes stop_codon:yes gene_type:complete